MVPVQNEDGSARTPGYVKLLKKVVTILPENSKRPNRINVGIAKACDAALFARPDVTWRGGLLCKTGVTATFNEGFEDTPAERILTIPYTSSIPEHLEEVIIVCEQWWSPLRAYQDAANAVWPALLNDESIPAYSANSMNRARIAGLSVDALWVLYRL